MEVWFCVPVNQLRALPTPIRFNMPTQFRMIHNVLEYVNKGDDQIPIIDVSKVETIQRMYWLRFLSLHIAWYVRNFSVSISIRSCHFSENDIHFIRWALLQIASYKTFYGSWIKLTRIAIYAVPHIKRLFDGRR